VRRKLGCVLVQPSHIARAFLFRKRLDLGTQLSEAAGVLCFALPDHKDAPAIVTQLRDVARIAGSISGNLAVPVAGVALHLARAVDAVRTAVPEAPMDEHAGFAACEHQIRLAGKMPPVQPEAEPLPVQEAADEELGCRVPAPDAAHVPASRIGRQFVHVSAARGDSNLRPSVVFR
jgi:hypothetical protein